MLAKNVWQHHGFDETDENVYLECNVGNFG